MINRSLSDQVRSHSEYVSAINLNDEIYNADLSDPVTVLFLSLSASIGNHQCWISYSSLQLFLHLHPCSITVIDMPTVLVIHNFGNSSPSRCVEVRKCHNVTIVLGAVETTLKVTDCENVSISAVCRRVLIRLNAMPSTLAFLSSRAAF